MQSQRIHTKETRVCLFMMRLADTICVSLRYKYHMINCEGWPSPPLALVFFYLFGFQFSTVAATWLLATPTTNAFRQGHDDLLKLSKP